MHSTFYCHLLHDFAVGNYGSLFFSSFPRKRPCQKLHNGTNKAEQHSFDHCLIQNCRRSSAPFFPQGTVSKKVTKSGRSQISSKTSGGEGQSRKTGLKRRKSAQTSGDDPKTGSDSSTSSDEVECDRRSPREGKLFRSSDSEPGRLGDSPLGGSVVTDQEPQLESLSVERKSISLVFSMNHKRTFNSSKVCIMSLYCRY